MSSKAKGELVIVQLEKAKKILMSENYTCVIADEEKVYISKLRGVSPLIAWYENNMRFQGFAAADKVVGKATAFLYLLLEVDSVYAGVISIEALKVLQKGEVDVEYGICVNNIINRTGTDICPFEKAVLDISDAHIAYYEIRNKMRELNISV